MRVSFSGDGCGAHWPTCNGQFVPQQMGAPMLIEYTHRMMTSIDTVAVLLLVLWAFLAFPKKSAVRRYAVFSLVFLLIEALLGAGLVLFRYVAHDQSAGRVWYLSAHLTNTMLLLATLAITAWLAASKRAELRLRAIPQPLLVGLAVTVFVSVTGTITALGDTLFPAASLAHGMQRDFAATSSMLLRLRVVHPLLALGGAIYLVWIAAGIRRAEESDDAHRSRAAAAVILVAVVQLAAGMLNLALLAPLAMQLTHLLIADVLWICVVLLAVESAGKKAVYDEPMPARTAN